MNPTDNRNTGGTANTGDIGGSRSTGDIGGSKSTGDTGTATGAPTIGNIQIVIIAAVSGVVILSGLVLAAVCGLLLYRRKKKKQIPPKNGANAKKIKKGKASLAPVDIESDQHRDSNKEESITNNQIVLVADNKKGN